MSATPWGERRRHDHSASEREQRQKEWAEFNDWLRKQRDQ